MFNAFNCVRPPKSLKYIKTFLRSLFLKNVVKVKSFYINFHFKTTTSIVNMLFLNTKYNKFWELLKYQNHEDDFNLNLSKSLFFNKSN